MPDEAVIGVINVSDRASRGEYEDTPGRNVLALLGEYLASPWRAEYAVVPDERDLIAATLRAMIDERGCCLVLTTGGTGPAPRDVTPEATRDVIERELPGFGEAMRAASLAKVPTAILSRQLAGTRGKALVVNLPGSPRAQRECLEVVFPAIPYCVDLVGGPRLETRPEAIKAFRPGQPQPSPRNQAISANHASTGPRSTNA